MAGSAGLAAELERLLAEASQIALRARENLRRELKPDGSIVTNADTDVETFLRQHLERLAPGVPMWGEEFGHEDPIEGSLWVMDPVDGTSNFAYGQPLWGITVALLRNGVIEAGAISLPDLGNTLSAERGRGARLDGQPLSPIPTGKIEPFELVGWGELKENRHKNAPGKGRHIGAFVVEVAMVARQQLRAMATGPIKLYDCAAGVLICRELGAEVRHFDGTTWDESQWMQPIKSPPFAIVPSGSNFPFGSL